MHLVAAQDFFQRVRSLGIDFDSRYPESGCLRVTSGGDHARFWEFPADPAAWPHFIASLLNGLDGWASGFLWPRSGAWPHGGQQEDERVRTVILRAAGISPGWAGAVQFGRDEEDFILAVVVAFMMFGWCVNDDLFFIPDHGRQLLQTDHHAVVHGQCTSEDRVQQLAVHMAEAGYELPIELPDETFCRPYWMPPPNGHCD